MIKEENFKKQIYKIKTCILKNQINSNNNKCKVKIYYLIQV